jgi:hypothetical protein
VLHDVDTRLLIAREHAELLHAEATLGATGQHRMRRWLSEQLIAAGNRLAPEREPRRRAAIQSSSSSLPQQLAHPPRAVS